MDDGRGGRGLSGLHRGHVEAAGVCERLLVAAPWDAAAVALPFPRERTAV